MWHLSDGSGAIPMHLGLRFQSVGINFVPLGAKTEVKAMGKTRFTLLLSLQM